uniref:Rieske domain-containing protein n=1 Tax=Thermosporothrix sp. COM3 TaxID=2490863 RepID=A0A455SQK3_9CHLR|nr:hypothetical protein KTC_54380 [Thermosporothrix sp. COM3]
MVTEIKTKPTTSWVDTPPRGPVLRHWSMRLINRLPWLDKLAQPLQDGLAKFFGAPGSSTYKAKDLLNGTWLGHPLHPLLVVLPLGCWTSSLLLDIAWMADKEKGTARAADLTLWAGITGAGAAAVTGATNWVDTDGPERRTGTMHALLNGGTLVLQLASALLRKTGRRNAAIALSSTGYALSLYSAYLGGELSFSDAIMVNRVAPEGGSDDFVPVMNANELEPGKLTRVEVAGVPAVLLKDGERIYAIAATCSHMGGPLDKGEYKDGVVYCPWHNSGFHMCDGSVANSPAVYAQPTFAVRVRNGKIELRRQEHA